MKQYASESLKALLHESGYKATPGRLSLLQILREEGKPMSPQQIAGKLRSVNQATVYRALEALALKGVVRHIDLGHSHAHYELQEKGNHHHHLICKECGAVEDVALCASGDIEKKVLDNSKDFNKITAHSLEFFGVCAKCS